MARISKSEKVPKPMQDTFNAIVALTDTSARLNSTENMPSWRGKPLRPCAVNARLHSPRGS
jgi:hypothetical protein